MAESLPATPPSPATAPAVAVNGQGQLAPTAAAAPAAKVTAQKFGGLAGGRKREDGLIPGSLEAVEADRKKDAARKREDRKARSKDPAALPSASMADQVKASGAAVGPGPGPETVSFLAWQPEALKPLFDQLIPAAEELTVHQLTERAAKAKLPAEVVRDIEAAAKWPTLAKKGMEASAPQLAAKWLNKAGISSEYQPEITFGTALSIIAANHVKLIRRLDKLITAANAQAGKAAEPKEDKP